MTEPLLSIQIRDGCATLAKEETRGVIGWAVRKLFLRAIQVLTVGHVMLEYGVARGTLRHARCGIDCHLAVKHTEVLAPEAGRLSVDREVRLPASHDLRGDAAMPRQAATGQHFLF